MQEMIRVTGLYAGYERQVILENVSFGIAAGEMVGLIGPNGAGKSTLLKTMRGILAPLAGEISVMGQRIGDLPAKEFAKSAAYLQQHLEMTFDYSAREVVLSGRYPYLSWWRQEQAHDIAIAEACMAYTGVAELAEKPLQAMSGGQRQRVLLAKVLAQQTPVLFLDEPATGLDVIIGRGALLADGLPREVLTAELLTRAYGAPIKVVENPLTNHDEVFTEAEKGAGKKSHLLQVILGREEAAS